MSQYFKVFLIAFIALFITMIGVELIRWQAYQEMFYKEIQIASLDAMALTVDEELKQGNILFIRDTEETKIILEDLLNKNIKVSLLYNSVLEKGIYIKNVNISEFKVIQGSYHMEQIDGVSRLVQDTFPEIIVKGNMDLIPLMARFNDFYLNVDIKNETEYIYTN